MRHVVAAVIFNEAKHVLIAERPHGKHLAGLWEFPGGKVEMDEAPFAALVRELREEIGIQVTEAIPLLQIPYTYPDRAVLLDIWQVQAFLGEPSGCEGQAIRWVPIDQLDNYPFPQANTAVIDFLKAGCPS